MSVGKVILRAWASAGRKVVPFFGLGWLTAVFYGGAVAFLLEKLCAAMLAGPQPGADRFNDFALFYLFCLVVVTAFANAVMGLPMTREALQPGGEWKTVYFSVARQEWGLFANLFLLYVIVIGLVAAVVFAGVVGMAVSLPMIGNGGVWNGVVLAPVMSGAIIVIAAAVGLFVATRLGFFLAVIAAANPPARLLQAWMLSRGKFWRLLTISLGLLVPVVVLALLVDWANLGSEFSDALTSFVLAPHTVSPLFRLIQGNIGIMATIWASALFLWNVIFANASADAYALAGHSVELAASHNFVSAAEPALAVAAVPTHAPLIEPAFQAIEETGPAPRVPEAQPEHVEVPLEPIAHDRAEESSAQFAAAEKATEPDYHQTEEIEFRTVEDPPSLLTVEPAAEATLVSEETRPEIMASSEEHQEPVMPQEVLPVVNPSDHVQEVEPDPANAEATPLPAFVEAHPSPEHEPSGAA